MPTVNDHPSVIYVRDISEEQANALKSIKSRFGISSNNAVVKSLFLKYLSLEGERDQLKNELQQLRRKNQENEERLNLLKKTFEMLNTL